MSGFKNNLRNITDRIGRNAQIDTFESFLLQMNSSKELTVKGCKSVCSCTPDEIILKHRYGTMFIHGEDMKIPVYSEYETVISGKVYTLNFLWEA